MTTYTRAEVATELLRDTGLVGEDETPSSAAQEGAEKVVEAGIGTLRSLGVILLDSDENNVQHELLYPIIDYCAPIVQRQNGEIDRATSVQLMRAAEQQIRRITSFGPSYAVLETEHY